MEGLQDGLMASKPSPYTSDAREGTAHLALHSNMHLFKTLATC